MRSLLSVVSCFVFWIAPGSPVSRADPPGPFEVGFHLIETEDPTREGPRWGKAAGLPSARPLRIYVWYPAKEKTKEGPVTFSRYAELMDTDFWPRAVEARQTSVGDFAAGPLAHSLSTERLQVWLAQPTHAFEDAPFADGPHPLVVFAQGLYYESPISHAFLCEHLASFGFVVATCPLIGTRSRLVHLDDVDLETAVRDLECVVARVRTMRTVDQQRLGLLGFDMGGMSGLILAMRNSDVDAFVSMDAGILYAHPSGIPASSPHYDPSSLRIPWMHLTRREAVPDPLAKGSLFETAVHAERFLVLIEGMRHTDFTSFALVENKRAVIGYWPEAQGRPRLKHEAFRRYIVRFFEAYLLGDEDARAFLDEDPADVVLPAAMPFTVAHHSAQPNPPTEEMFVNQVFTEGIAAATAAVREARESFPDCALLREETLNRLGYQFLYFWGHTDVAVGIFQLAVELHPESANLHDSLGEGYFFLGERELAAKSYRRSLELDPTNENAKVMLRKL